MAMAFSLQQGPWQKDKKLKKQENQEKARKRRRQKEKTKRNIIYKKNKDKKPEKKHLPSLTLTTWDHQSSVRFMAHP